MADVIARDENYGPNGLVSYTEYYSDNTCKAFVVENKKSREIRQRNQTDEERVRCGEYLSRTPATNTPVKR